MRDRAKEYQGNRSLREEKDDRWRTKGGPHIKPHHHEPEVCPACGGTGEVGGDFNVCGRCGGTGEE